MAHHRCWKRSENDLADAVEVKPSYYERGSARYGSEQPMTDSPAGFGGCFGSGECAEAGGTNELAVVFGDALAAIEMLAARAAADGFALAMQIAANLA